MGAGGGWGASRALMRLREGGGAPPALSCAPVVAHSHQPPTPPALSPRSRPLTDFFLSPRWQEELNRDNPLGTKGLLAEAYVDLVKEMWCVSAVRQWRSWLGGGRVGE